MTTTIEVGATVTMSGKRGTFTVTQLKPCSVTGIPCAFIGRDGKAKWFAPLSMLTLATK